MSAGRTASSDFRRPGVGAMVDCRQRQWRRRRKIGIYTRRERRRSWRSRPAQCQSVTRQRIGLAATCIGRSMLAAAPAALAQTRGDVYHIIDPTIDPLCQKCCHSPQTLEHCSGYKLFQWVPNNDDFKSSVSQLIRGHCTRWQPVIGCARWWCTRCDRQHVFSWHATQTPSSSSSWQLTDDLTQRSKNKRIIEIHPSPPASR